MHLFQLLLPLRDNAGLAFPAAHYETVRTVLTDKFRGLTAFTRTPAEGLWKDSENAVARDDIVIFEVMSEQLDQAWWHNYKLSLQKLFAQDEIVIRVQEISVIK